MRVTGSARFTVTLPISFTTGSAVLTHRGRGGNPMVTDAMLWACDSRPMSTLVILNTTSTGSFTASLIVVGY